VRSPKDEILVMHPVKLHGRVYEMPRCHILHLVRMGEELIVYNQTIRQGADGTWWLITARGAHLYDNPTKLFRRVLRRKK
jgi:hypothetical protein